MGRYSGACSNYGAALTFSCFILLSHPFSHRTLYLFVGLHFLPHFNFEKLKKQQEKALMVARLDIMP